LKAGNGKQHYLWSAVDQDGEMVDVYLQAKRDGAAAKRFFRRLLRSHGGGPRKIVTAHAAVQNLFNFRLIYSAANGTPEILRMPLTTVPLPAAAWLFGSALFGLGFVKRRKA
jgi:hypothetical protein